MRQKSIPREWINAHGNDIRQELYNYLYPLIQGEVSLTYQKRCTGVYAGSSFKTRSRLIKKESFMAKQTTSLRVLRAFSAVQVQLSSASMQVFVFITTGIISPIQPSVGFPVATRLRMIWKQKHCFRAKLPAAHNGSQREQIHTFRK